MKNYVLIASVGRSDIKFVLTDKNEKNEFYLAEIADRCDCCLSIRKVHEALRDNEIKHHFCKETLNKIKNNREKIRFCQQNDEIQAKVDSDFSLKKTQKDEICIYAAKLQGLIETLQKLQNDQKIQIKAALFLGTERKKQSGEPAASHILLARHFADTLGFEAAADLNDTNINQNTNVFWANQTLELNQDDWQGNTKYEGTGIDYPVRRIIARRIDLIIQDFLNRFETDKPQILLSDTGGISDLKALLSASVKFRARNTVYEIPQTELSEKFDIDAFNELVNQPQYISRQQSLQIKHLVESRIQNGDFSGAWAACTHIHTECNKQNHDIWTYAVEAVRNYFLGDNSFNLSEIIKKMPEEARETKKHFTELSEQLDKLTANKNDTHKKQAEATLTHIMFQVEAALQAQTKEEIDIINATIQTSALNDQLLRSCIFYYLNKNKSQFKNLINKLNYYDDLVLTKDWHDNKDKRFDRKKIKPFYGRDAWRNSLKTDNQLNIVNNYFERLTLPKKSLQKKRNAIAHSLGMNRDDLEKILDIATLSQDTFSLWNPGLMALWQNHTSSPIAPGENFLNQHYVKEIETALGFENTQQKYTQLQTTLLAIIRDTIYIPDTETTGENKRK